MFKTLIFVALKYFKIYIIMINDINNLNLILNLSL